MLKNKLMKEMLPVYFYNTDPIYDSVLHANYHIGQKYLSNVKVRMQEATPQHPPPKSEIPWKDPVNTLDTHSSRSRIVERFAQLYCEFQHKKSNIQTFCETTPLPLAHSSDVRSPKNDK